MHRPTSYFGLASRWCTILELIHTGAGGEEAIDTLEPFRTTRMQA
jgi:hypothetical protein